jgi:hypothetical protein
MKQRFEAGGHESPEQFEDQKYEEWKTAAERVDAIRRDIQAVLSSTPNRAEAERIILEQHAPLLDQATKESDSALDSWLEAMRATRRSQESGLSQP